MSTEAAAQREAASGHGTARRLRVPFVACVLATFGAALLPACDLPAIEAEKNSVCVEAGAQCVLAKGPLGVCERSPCRPGEPEPCFQCTPQH